jgi:hypothetical protein
LYNIYNHASRERDRILIPEKYTKQIIIKNWRINLFKGLVIINKSEKIPRRKIKVKKYNAK